MEGAVPALTRRASPTAQRSAGAAPRRAATCQRAGVRRAVASAKLRRQHPRTAGKPARASGLDRVAIRHKRELQSQHVKMPAAGCREDQHARGGRPSYGEVGWLGLSRGLKVGHRRRDIMIILQGRRLETAGSAEGPGWSRTPYMVWSILLQLESAAMACRSFPSGCVGAHAAAARRRRTEATAAS